MKRMTLELLIFLIKVFLGALTRNGSALLS